VPIKTIHESFNKVSSYYTDIQYENNLKIGDFADPFIRNGFFSKKFEKIGERLGKGSSGKVFKVRIEPEENKFSAIKIIKEKANVEKEFFKEFTNFFFIKNIESEYFIKHFDAWFEINTDRKLTFYIEMELCDTTLRKLFDEISNDSILKKGDSLTSIGYYIASELFIEILEGVQFLHDNDIIHRDLNLSNIMIKKNENSERFIKIGDFGIIAIHKKAKPIHSTGIGTNDYMAPEVIGGQYWTIADIFSLGVILREIFDISYSE
jgi:serine/threonine protein kinase